MKEFVLVEFMCVQHESNELANRVRALQEEFQFVRTDTSEEVDDVDVYRLYFHIFGKISSEAASFIRLQDDFLAQRMRISYISDELKDKYRTKK